MLNGRAMVIMHECSFINANPTCSWADKNHPLTKTAISQTPCRVNFPP